MRFLFDIGHPAHVHLFKNYIHYLQEKGNSVCVVSRKKDVTELLLDHYKINHFPITKPASTKAGMLRELYKRNNIIFDLHRKKHFDISLGTSVSIGFLNLRYGVPAYNFNEDDDDVIKLYTLLSYPLTTKIINPDCLKYNNWNSKRILYPSYHELAYLHPNNFVPDEKVVHSYGLVPYNYIILRLSALKAHHDFGIKGIATELLSSIKKVIVNHKVIESQELKKDYQVKPWDMHHILAYAKLLITDSQTMTAEAAVLGVPSLRINDFVNKISYLKELEYSYSLTYGYKPDRKEEILEKIIYFIDNSNVIVKEWSQKRIKLLKDKIDFNKWMIDYFRF